MASASALGHGAADVTGGFECVQPYGTSWSRRNPPSRTAPMVRRVRRVRCVRSAMGASCPRPDPSSHQTLVLRPPGAESGSAVAGELEAAFGDDAAEDLAGAAVDRGDLAVA